MAFLVVTNAVENAEGHPGQKSLFPWTVRLKESVCEKLGLSCRFICKAGELHKTAALWKVFLQTEKKLCS